MQIWVRTPPDPGAVVPPQTWVQTRVSKGHLAFGSDPGQIRKRGLHLWFDAALNRGDQKAPRRATMLEEPLPRHLQQTPRFFGAQRRRHAPPNTHQTWVYLGLRPRSDPPRPGSRTSPKSCMSVRPKPRPNAARVWSSCPAPPPDPRRGGRARPSAPGAAAQQAPHPLLAPRLSSPLLARRMSTPAHQVELASLPGGDVLGAPRAGPPRFARAGRYPHAPRRAPGAPQARLTRRTKKG